MPALDPLIKNHVTVTGNTEAPETLVFVHGFGTDQHAWDALIPAFMRDYRLVLIDNAGAGKFDPEAFESARYINLHGFAEDLLDICTVLNIKNSVLIGHSAGAMIGVLASIKRPELFSRMVLIGASPRYVNEPGYHGGFEKKDIDDVFSAMAEKYHEWVHGFAPLMMGNPNRSNLSAAFAKQLESIPTKTALTVAHAIFTSDHRSDIPKIRQPTLLIQTRDDAAIPLSVAHYLHQHIPHSTLDVIDATGHLPHISAADAVIAAILRFLAQPSGTNSANA